MTINGTDTKAWGMIPVKTSGHFDMPSRRGEIMYDWGDEFEPLFGSYYTAFEPRVITVEFLYDPRIQTIGNATPNWVDVWVESYKTVTELTLGIEGEFGDRIVTVTEVNNNKKYRGANQKITFVFEERVPTFNGSLPGTKNGGFFSIDGYSISQFNLILKESKVTSLGTSLESSETVFLEAPKKRDVRNFASIFLDLYLVSSNPARDLANFQKVLAQEKVMTLEYGSISFQVLFVTGFQTQRLNLGAFKLTLNLLRL